MKKFKLKQMVLKLYIIIVMFGVNLYIGLHSFLKSNKEDKLWKQKN